jgi:hypothetical protein
MLAAPAAVGLLIAAAPAFARPLDSNCSKIEGSEIGPDGVSVTAEGVRGPSRRRRWYLLTSVGTGEQREPAGNCRLSR